MEFGLGSIPYSSFSPFFSCSLSSFWGDTMKGNENFFLRDLGAICFILLVITGSIWTGHKVSEEIEQEKKMGACLINVAEDYCNENNMTFKQGTFETFVCSYSNSRSLDTKKFVFLPDEINRCKE